VVTFVELGEDDLPVAAVKERLTRRVRQDNRDKALGIELTVASVADAPDSIPEDADVESDDLAAVVVKKTNRLLASGKVVPTLRDGLQAQQLLDRRAEKAADRSFMLNLALALAGGGRQTPAALLPPGPNPDDDIIEGEFSEQNLAPTHLRQA
jgi:hypothetical protein